MPDWPILDESLLSRLVAEYEIETVFHLAALLSTRAEFTPETDFRVSITQALPATHDDLAKESFCIINPAGIPAQHRKVIHRG